MKKILKWIYDFCQPAPVLGNVEDRLSIQTDDDCVSDFVRESNVTGESELEGFDSDEVLQPIVDITITGCLQNEAMLYDEDD